MKHNLSQITKQRMLDNAFGLDFISLARPTIKTVPLFLVECRNEGVKNFYEIPHWMRISYVDCNKEMRLLDDINHYIIIHLKSFISISFLIANHMIQGSKVI